MTGIKRLRALAGAWDEWGLGGALAEIADEIEREQSECLMPEGMEWPRYEDKEPVRIGDVVSDVEVRSVVFRDDGILLSDCTSVPGWGTWRSYKEPIRRPAVPAADGEPLEVGQTVWDTDAETDTPLTVVEVSSDLVRCEYTWKDGRTYRPCYPPDQLTHTKPEIDSWERIEEDAGCTATKYNERRGTIFTTKQQVARDLVRRCRALSERERGE